MNALLFGLYTNQVHAADDVASAIAAANRNFELAVQRGDANAVAALYTTDGQVLAAQREVQTGTKAIAEFWKATFDAGVKGATFLTVELESHGGFAYEVATYQFRNADGEVVDYGKYVVIWKRQGGEWKLHRDIFNTSVSPSAPPSNAESPAPK